jgi:hypothetical protein
VGGHVLSRAVRNEHFANNCIQEVDRFGGGSVMMWAAISHTGKTALVHIPGNLTAQCYCDEILQPHVLPLMQQNGARFHSVAVAILYVSEPIEIGLDGVGGSKQEL